VSKGKATPRHAQREYTPDSADASLAGRNVVIKTTKDHKAAFNEFFRPAIEDYNATQKRKSRQKSLDYWEECEGEKELAWAVQIGNRETLGVLTEDAIKKGIDKEWKAAREAGKPFDLKPWLNTSADRVALKGTLERIGRKLPEKFPNIEFTTIVLHDDEPCGTPHLDVIGFPHATGYTQNGKPASVQTRCSLTRALKDMGYKDIEEFSAAFRDFVQEEMEADGYEVEPGKSHEARLPVDRFRDLKAREAALQAREKQADFQELRLKGREAILTDRERKLDEAVSKYTQESKKALEGLRKAQKAQESLAERLEAFELKRGKPKSAENIRAASTKASKAAESAAKVAETVKPVKPSRYTWDIDAAFNNIERPSGPDNDYSL